MKLFICQRLSIAALLLVFAVATAASAAEIHLRRECRTSGALVTLGDVAEISAQDEAEQSRLAAIELFPAPSGEQARLVRLRDVQDLLVQRGLNLRELRLSGASTVRVFGSDDNVRQASATSVEATDTVKNQLETAIEDYLRQQGNIDTAWHASIESRSDVLAEIPADAQSLQIIGGVAPFTGRQLFQVSFQSGLRKRQLTVTARVSRPRGVVVAKIALKRGDLIHAADLELTTDHSPATTDDVLTEIASAVGFEVTRPIAAGQAIPRSGLQLPQLVQRGDIVAVYSRTRGIQVRTSAKAKEDGSRDELIQLESLLDREQTFTARVTGRKEVEIFAGAPRVESTRPTAASAVKPASANAPASVGQPSLFGLKVGGVNEVTNRNRN